MYIFNKAFTIARDEGILALVRRAIRRLFYIVSHERGYLLTNDTLAGSAKEESKIPITCEFLAGDDLEEFVQLDYFNRSLPMLKKLSNAGRVLVAKHEGKIVAGFHYAIGKTRLFNWEVPLDQDAARPREVFTVPEYRGQNIMPALLCFFASYLADQGFRKLYMFILPENAPSLRAAEKSGFRIVGPVGHVNIWNLHLYYGSNMRTLAITKTPFYFRRGK